jgi:hypothetical protein
MKSAVVFVLLLAGGSLLLGDSPKPASSSRRPATLLDDLVQMTRGGSSDVTVLAYAKAHRLELPSELSDADLRWLRNSGVSELVVRYMAAVDVRASAEATQAVATRGSYEDAPRARSAYSSESDADSDQDGYSESYAGGETYPDDSYYSYPDDSYDAYAGYDYDFYPSFGYGYFPYPFFFVDRGGFFRRFDRRDRRFNGRRGGPVGFREAWRDRDFRGRRGTSMAVGPRASRGSARPAFERGGFGRRTQDSLRPRGYAAGRRGFGLPGPGRGNMPPAFRSPRGGTGGHSFGSGGPHAGRSFSAGRTGFSGGGRAPAGPTGGRGRH